MRRVIALLLFASLAAAQGQPQHAPIFVVGGDGSTGRFEYNGEGAGDCGGDLCRGGTCTGTAPTGTCTLALNAYFGRTPADTGSNYESGIFNFSECLITAGTVTLATGGSALSGGQALILRCQSDFTMSGGTLTMNALGTAGATGGACASVNAGKAGGSNLALPGGTAGTSGGTNGGAGNAYSGDLKLFPYAAIGGIGAGGGACPTAGQTGAFSTTEISTAGTGGGGGGCAALCSGTCSAGARGGGMLWIEAGNSLACPGGTISADGGDAASGGGGGGGGGSVTFLAPTIDGNCTASVAAGDAGATPPTNCGTGGAGGAGIVSFLNVPR